MGKTQREKKTKHVSIKDLGVTLLAGIEELRDTHPEASKNWEACQATLRDVRRNVEQAAASKRARLATQPPRNLELGDVVQCDGMSAGVVMATTRLREQHFARGRGGGRVTTWVTCYCACTTNPKYVQCVTKKENEFTRLDMRFRWPPISLDPPRLLGGINKQMRAMTDGEDETGCDIELELKTAGRLINELRHELYKRQWQRDGKDISYLKNKLGVIMNLSEICPSLLALLREELHELKTKLGKGEIDFDRSDSGPKRITFGWRHGGKVLYQHPELEGRIYSILSRYYGSNNEGGKSRDKVFARCPSERLITFAKVIECILVEFGFMPACCINNVQILRYLQGDEIGQHNDNKSASVEGLAANSQRFGTPTITVSLGDAMDFSLVEGGKGLGLFEGTGIQEKHRLGDGKMLTLDPFTDNALEHKAKWPAGALPTVERWVFVFRSTQLMDYFDTQTHAAIEHLR